MVLYVRKEVYPNESEQLLTICREGVSVGISVVIANTQTTGFGYKYLSNFAQRIALFCNDTGEYSSLFNRSRLTPENLPGRGLIELDKRILEYQTYLSFAGEREIDRVRDIKAFAFTGYLICQKKPSCSAYSTSASESAVMQ